MPRLLLLFAFAFAVACEKPADDVTQIRALVDDAAQLAEAHDVNGVMAHVTPDYSAKPGDRDEQSVRPILLMAFRRYGTFRVEYPVPGIEVDDEAKTATVSVPFLIVREGQKFPAADLKSMADDPVAWAAKVAETVGDPYQLDLDLRKTPDGWQVHQSEIAGFKNVHDL